FLTTRTLSNSVSRWVSFLVSKNVKNGIQEVVVGAIEVQRTVCRESKKKDYKAPFLIHNIASANSAKEAWDILNKSYGGADKIKKVKLQSLQRQYALLSMNDQESNRDYFTRI
ncbi:hypothetical protein CR513_13544, partial [Mucuna pruriens]